MAKRSREGKWMMTVRGELHDGRRMEVIGELVIDEDTGEFTVVGKICSTDDNPTQPKPDLVFPHLNVKTTRRPRRPSQRRGRLHDGLVRPLKTTC
jgi:hypothetical protein